MSDDGKEEVAIESTTENTEPETKPDEAVGEQAPAEATSSEAEAVPQAEAKVDEEPKEKDVAEPEPSASTEENPEETKEEEEPVPKSESSAKEETAATEDDDDESELILNDDDEDEGEAAPKKRLRLRSREDRSEDGDDVVLGDEEPEEDSGKSSKKEKLKRKKRATRSQDEEQEEEEPKEESNGKEAKEEEDSLADERRQAMRDIFGEGSDSDEDEPEIHIESDQEDMDFESSKTALERLKKKSRAKKRKMAEEDDEEDGKKRKRQSRKKKGDGEEKKRRRSRQDDEEGENPEEDDGGDRVTEGGSSKKPRKEADEFDKIISTIRGGYRRRKPNLGGDEGKAKISELVNQMFLAHESDLAAYEAKKPATQKLKLLQEVVENFSRKVFTQTVVECDGLRAIRLWLEPLPGGTLPNINIRKSLLDVLGRLPVDPESLKSSRIAGVVLFLARNPNETPENKALAKQLIDSWSRPIFGISSSHKSHHDEEEVEPSAPREAPRNKVVVDTASTDTGLEDPVKKSSSASSSSSSTSSPTTNLLEYPTQGIHARIPRPVAFDFTKRPVSRLEVTEKSKPDPKRLNLERSMQNLKKKKVKNARAVSLSIEGRRLML